MPDLCTTNGPYEIKGDEVRQREQVLDGDMRLPSIRICKVGGYSDGYRASEIAELLNRGSHFEALDGALGQACAVLELMADPPKGEAIPSIQTAWAQCIEAARKGRAARKAARGEGKAKP